MPVESQLALAADVSWNDDYCEVCFHLSDGRVIVTSNVDPGSAILFASQAHRQAAVRPEDALEVYDSVAEAFAALA